MTSPQVSRAPRLDMSPEEYHTGPTPRIFIRTRLLYPDSPATDHTLCIYVGDDRSREVVGHSVNTRLISFDFFKPYNTSHSTSHLSSSLHCQVGSSSPYHPSKMAPSSTATDKKPITRTTRARAAKDAPTTSALGQPGGKPGGGLLSRGKEGLRMVSEKLKDKEKEKEKDKGKEKETSSRLPPASSSNQSIASLESLKAYLRIRPPPPGDAAHEPYLTVQNEREVLMRSTQVSHPYEKRR